MNRGGYIFKLLLLLIVVGAVFATYYIANQKNAEKLSGAEDITVAPEQDPGQLIPGWGTYTNPAFSYTVQYPPNLPPYETSDSKQRSVKFGCQSPNTCIPLFYVSIMQYPAYSVRDITIYNSLAQPVITKIFVLNLGEELDQKTTYEIGGQWNFTTRYKRLPDEVIGGEQFLVIENPTWYGGSDRRLFLKKNNNVYMIGGTYASPEQLSILKKMYSSFRFSQ